jgi:hypothetical protein
MAPQTHRRTLVVLIYAGLAALMVGCWLLDRWHVTGVYMIFATILVNRVLLGGYNTGGLIKKFDGKTPRQRMALPPFLVLGLRLYEPEPEERDYRNDEREVAQRDRAHYQAYQVLVFALMTIWLLSDWRAMSPKMLAWLPVSADLLLYGLVLAAIMLSQTLPQSILLWNEPDMEEFDPADLEIQQRV